jgi:uncharacterized protein involved in outer membrane biogenesis
VWQQFLEDRISSAVGASVSFEKLSLSPFRGVIDGTGLAARLNDAVTPFLTVERVQLKVKISELFAKRLAIETILLDRPAVTIERGGDGTWNLPLPKPSPPPAAAAPPLSAEAGGSSWGAGVRQIILTDGQVRYRDHSSGFDGYSVEAAPINVQFDQPGGQATLTGSIGSLRRTDRPAELGLLRLLGEGTGLDDISKIQTATGRLSAEVKDFFRLDLDAAATTIRLALQAQLAVDRLFELLPEAWAQKLPTFLRTAKSEVKAETTLERPGAVPAAPVAHLVDNPQ